MMNPYQSIYYRIFQFIALGLSSREVFKVTDVPYGFDPIREVGNKNYAKKCLIIDVFLPVLYSFDNRNIHLTIHMTFFQAYHCTATNAIQEITPTAKNTLTGTTKTRLPSDPKNAKWTPPNIALRPRVYGEVSCVSKLNKGLSSSHKLLFLNFGTSKRVDLIASIIGYHQIMAPD